MKFFQLFLLLSISGFILSQDCNNPLQRALNIDGLSQPAIPTGNLTFCPNFAGQNVCCSANTMNGFQSRVDSVTSQLEREAGRRDRWFEDNYNTGFTNFLQNFFIFQANMEAIRNNTQLFNAARQKFAYINNNTGTLRESVETLAADFAQYQQARATCFQTMIDFHASAHCLACNPNYNSLGVFDNGTVILNDAMCTTIKDSCFNYVQLSNSYSILIALRQVSEQLYEANDFFRDLDINDADAVEEVQDEEVPYESDLNIDNPLLRPTNLPPNCTTAQDCDWLCNQAFNPTELNIQALALGGVPTNSLSLEEIARRSENVGQAGGRRLQDNEAQNTTETDNADNADNNQDQGNQTAAADDENQQDQNQNQNQNQDEPSSSLDNVDDPNTVVGTEPALTGGAGTAADEGDEDDGSLDNVAADDSVIGPDPVTAEGGDDDVATGPITSTGEIGRIATGTWNPPVGNSGAIITLDENPANVTLDQQVNVTNLEQAARAFQEGPDPTDGFEDQQEALGGSVLTISSILLGTLVMFYLS